MYASISLIEIKPCPWKTRARLYRIVNVIAGGLATRGHWPSCAWIFAPDISMNTQWPRFLSNSIMMTWNGYISSLLSLCVGNPKKVCVTVPLQRDSNADVWCCFFCCQSEQTVEQTLDWQVIRDTMTVIWRRRNELIINQSMFTSTVLKPDYSGRIILIPWPLMSWSPATLGHLQP